VESPTPIQPVTHDLPTTLVENDRSMWRYRSAIPVAPASIVSMGEGLTPLLKGPGGLHMKCDYLSPSGSFKDRGASAMVSGLKERGVSRCFLDSSGNAGAAVALYTAAASIQCDVMVPADTPETKSRQAAAFGANVIRLEGNREEVAAAARERARSGDTYASHNWDPLFIHGTKTIAFELFEQCGGHIPDHVILPVGYGSSLLGCYIGFSELVANGTCERLPKLHAAQAAACAPLHLAFTSGAATTAAMTPAATVASAIAASNPLRGEALLSTLRSTRGQTVAVSEEAISTAQAELGRAGFYVEPSSAVAYAAAGDLRQREVIGPEETAVVLLTGSGLKT
jgi:threonine synthase